MPAASLTLSFVLAMLGKSFRWFARGVFPRANARKLAPLALAGVLAGCGGSASSPAPAGKTVAGPGFAFRAPAGWRVKKTLAAAEARKGDAIVSVTVFRLAKAYRPALWPKVVPELDRVASELATRVHGKVESSSTETIGGERARVYAIVRSGEDERIAFVLHGRREYQLYCRGAGSACDELFASFSLSA